MIKDFEIWDIYEMDSENIFSWYNEDDIEYRLDIAYTQYSFNIWVNQQTPDISYDLNSIRWFTI